MYLILSLGGSLVNTEKGIDVEYLTQIKKIVEKNEAFFGIVVGGGYEARRKVMKARENEANEFECDEAGIKTTWKNAKALISALGPLAYKKVIKDFAKARKLKEISKVLVMGGTIPGITTDADSALLAEALGAKKLINISNTDAIYDSDPKTNPNAKKFSEMNYDQLIGLAVSNDKRAPGTNFIFDLLACKIISRSRIETHFVSGKLIGEVENAINGRPHSGTIVKG